MKPAYFVGLAVMVVALVSMPVDALAQGNINFGIKAGGSLLKMGGDDTQGTDFRSHTGLTAGAFVEIGLTDRLSLQPEVINSVKGVKYRYGINDGVNDGVIEETNELSYLQFPVLAKLTLPATGSITPSLFAGPSVAVNLSGTSRGRDVHGNLFPWEGGNYGWDGDIANLKTLDFSAVIGGSLAIPLGSMSAFVDMRYDFSLSTAVKEIDQYGTPNYDAGDEIPFVSSPTGAAKDMRNRAVSVSMGLVLPF